MIEFLDDIHLYLVDGIITPSVTQILKSGEIGADYKSVPFSVLKNKANYGNEMHDIIETYCLTGENKSKSGIMDISIDQFENIKRQRKISIESCEKAVSYKTEYAGTYDMYGTVSGKKALIDIKTTYKYDEDYLSWQLGMYKLAMEENGLKIEKCYCLWLPKMKMARFLDVEPKGKSEILELLERVKNGEINTSEEL